MAEAVGVTVVTDRVGREAILADPSVSRRLVSTRINLNNPQNLWLREPDGVAVFGKQGRLDYCLLAPTIEEVTPHNRRLLAHIFLDTDGTTAWFDSESEAGTEFGAIPVGNYSKLTGDERGQPRPVMFHTWRLPVAAWMRNHDEIRVTGGQVRRMLQKNGASLGNGKDQDELDRRLGFLALTVKSGQPDKGVGTFNEWCILHGIPAIHPIGSHSVGSKQAVEFEMFGVRVKAVDGKLSMAAGSA